MIVVAVRRPKGIKAFLLFIFIATAVITRFESEPRNRKDCLSAKISAAVKMASIVATEYISKMFSYFIK
jgi:hypothetical protein